MNFNQLIARLAAHPRQLFLLDSAGGYVSASVPLIILWTCEAHVGLPRELLIAMSLTGCVYGSYSLICALSIRLRWVFFLKILVGANSAYLCSLMAYTLINLSSLSQLGLAYLLLDHLVLISVIAIELAATVALSDADGRGESPHETHHHIPELLPSSHASVDQQDGAPVTRGVDDGPR